LGGAEVGWFLFFFDLFARHFLGKFIIVGKGKYVPALRGPKKRHAEGF
jgi:hypothetical protein